MGWQHTVIESQDEYEMFSFYPFLSVPFIHFNVAISSVSFFYPYIITHLNHFTVVALTVTLVWRLVSWRNKLDDEAIL